MPNCQKCGGDNPDSAISCAHCGADLSGPARSSESLPAGAGYGGGLLRLATFHTISEADMVRELLESNGITCVLHGENDPIGAMSGAEPIIMLVEEKSLPRATELYEAFFAGEAAVQEDGSRGEIE